MILNDAASVRYNGREPEVWLGGTPPVKVWPSGREVVDIALGAGFAARDQFRAALTARGLDYTTITEVPFEINLTGTGEATHLFRGCVALTTGPELDTRNVTNMNGMFQDCTNLASVPPMNTSNVKNAPSMFAYCRALTSVPTMNAAKMTNVSYMFVGCVALTDGNVLLTNRNPAVNSAGMIAGSGLTREPWDTTDGGQRTVSIRTHYSSPNNMWTSGTQAGATDLITYFSERYIRLSEAVTCNRPVSAMGTIAPGGVIPAGRDIYPLDWGVTFTFTTT